MRTSGTGARRRSMRWSSRVGGALSGRNDRGDVPGWVLVTLMTAGLVSALWLVAGDALVNLFQTAISHVAP